jgi:hypothetical protein
MESPTYGTQTPQNPIGSTYTSNYPQQSGSGYPTSGTYGAGGYPMNTQGGYQQPYTQDTNKVRVTAMVLILLGVLLLLIAIILFVLQRTNAFAEIASPNTMMAMISTI